MAKYNAAKHTIESDDGSIALATLHPTVRADKGFEIADWWGGDNEVMEALNEELSMTERDKWNAEGRAEYAESERYKVENKLDAALARIDELETELADLKEKGASAA